MAQPTRLSTRLIFFFFNDTATTEIYTLSLHDALPISPCRGWAVPSHGGEALNVRRDAKNRSVLPQCGERSEEHTSELQSHVNLVCRLLLEKKKKKKKTTKNKKKKKKKKQKKNKHKKT